jgi:nitroreductase
VFKSIDPKAPVDLGRGFCLTFIARGGVFVDLFEAIAKRHSYRGPFLDKPVPAEDLRRIVQAGIQAPSGKNAQTTSFVIVDAPDLVQQIAQMHANNQAFQQAKAFIACLVDVNPEAIYEGYHFQVEDCAASVENMLLAVTAMGYATVWIDGWLRVQERSAKIGELLGVPAGKIIRIILPIGVPAEQWSQKERLPLEQRAWFNRYGGAP